MDHNEREFFLYRILSGVAKCKFAEKTIYIYPPTKEIYREACEYYQDAYDLYLSENILVAEIMSEKMMEMDLWSWNKEKDMENLIKFIEDTKFLAYENRSDRAKIRQLKNTVYLSEQKMQEIYSQKMMYQHQTCEGLAAKDKLLYIIKNCSYTRLNKKVKYVNFSPSHLLSEFNNFHLLEERIIREIARTEPWRTNWIIKENSKKSLVFYPDLELTNNQKSLIAWSQTYDNVYQSMDSPPENVIQDDFLLDGWFIKQSRDRKQKSAKEDLNDSIINPKIKNAQEVYKVVGNDKEAAKRVESLNNPFAALIKKQRESLINSRGSVEQKDLLDEKLRASKITK